MVSDQSNSPYLWDMVPVRRYNPDYGDHRLCWCDHAYYRHFDSYEHMDPVGCKYRGCNVFSEKKLG